MTPEDRIEITNDLLSRFPAYGEFEVALNPPPTMTVVNSAHEAINTMEQLAAEEITTLDRFNRQQEVIQDLIFGGFIINRTDISRKNKMYRQLTDQGRELKELGSLEAYNKVQKEKKDKIKRDDEDRKSEQTRNKYQFYVNVFLAISTGIAAIYYLKELWIYFFQSCHCH